LISACAAKARTLPVITIAITDRIGFDVFGSFGEIFKKFSYFNMNKMQPYVPFAEFKIGRVQIHSKVIL